MKNEIGKNESSGAKKVERVEKENFTQDSVDSMQTPVKETKTKDGGTMSETSKKKTSKPRTTTAKKKAVVKEEAAANKRVAEAKKRAGKKEEKLAKKTSVKQAKIEKKAEIKQKKLEKKQAVAEKKLARKEMIAKKKAERLENRAKRKADLKAKRIERRSEKAARREILKNESKSERAKRLEREKRERIAAKRRKAEARERAHENKLKAREAAHVRKAEDKKHRREQKTERRRNGYGGWLAAVISLGTACLVLGALVTAGAFRMNDMAVEAESGYRTTLYEMVSACEDLDDSLGKLRVSSGAGEQRKLLTNILVDTALLEASVERIPVDAATGTSISAFINNTGSYARMLLSKLASGQPIAQEDKARIANLYEVNDSIYGELNGLITETPSLKEFFGKLGGFGEKLQSAEQNADITEAPFSEEGNIGENRLTRLEEISSSEAEALARQYFENYRVKEVRYTGETVTNDFSAYDFVLTDEDGLEIFAQITKHGGKLLFFDTYEECHDKNFSLEECDALARSFLAELGIGDVEAVWLSDGGMVANLTYTTVVSGVRVYPEIIRVRVCEEKGRVVGMDARGYLVNDKDYDVHYTLDKAEAQKYLSEGLEPYAVNLALIPVGGKGRVAYEFGCNYGEDEYIVYIDADTGEELEIFRVMPSARGNYLR